MFAKGWRKVRGAGPQRLAITTLLLVAALLLARMSWGLPFTGNAERALFDARSYALADEVDQDERILLVVYTDNTLINLRKRSPLDRGLLAAALRNIDQMGAQAIALDMLFDQEQDEDPLLLETLQNMQTPVAVGFAETGMNEDEIGYRQEQYLRSFLAQLEGSKARPASVMLNDAFGATRIWPDLVEGLPPVLGRVMLEDSGREDLTMPGYQGSIRYQLPRKETYLIDESTGEMGEDIVPVFSSLDIELFADPQNAVWLAELVEGRYVMIGGDIVDVDRVPTTFSSIDAQVPPGLEVQATMLAQMLDGAQLRPAANWAMWALALLTVIAAALTALLELKSWQFIPFVLAELALFLGLPFWLHAQGVDTYGFPAIGPMLGWVLSFTAVTGAARASTAVERRFAQGALGKYLPREMADQIIENPDLLALHGEKKAIFVLFSDLEGFTKMSHAIEPEMVAKLLNRYLEMLSQVVLDHGGVIDKFVGDAVVAFWGAPIAREDDATRAARAGYAIWQAGEDFRKEVAEMDPSLPLVGKTRVGLHYGEAVVGNFGGDTRIQYTALGDSMNTAARLESANKMFKTSVMASGDFASRTDLNWWRRMGRVVLSGRSQPVDLYEPAPDFPEADRKALATAVELLDADQPAALEQLQAIASKHKDDAGLQALLERSRDLNDEGAHILGGK